VRAVERGTELTGKLLTFARRDADTAMEIMDVDAVVGESVEFLRRLLPAEVDLRIDLAAGAGVRGNPSQIDRLLSNLLVNARDAMDGGGIRVGTEIVQVDEGLALGHGVAPGRFVVISVEDDGAGMDQETLERIFEPFFTTKSDGQGTGLGLATCYGLVSAMGGFMTVASRPGAGSTFRSFLPMV